eukprot:COSAG01_NODE_440_length_17033_cov_16.301110_6_plen_100_part_00
MEAAKARLAAAEAAARAMESGQPAPRVVTMKPAARRMAASEMTIASCQCLGTIDVTGEDAVKPYTVRAARPSTFVACMRSARKVSHDKTDCCRPVRYIA